VIYKISGATDNAAAGNYQTCIGINGNISKLVFSVIEQLWIFSNVQRSVTAVTVDRKLTRFSGSSSFAACSGCPLGTVNTKVGNFGEAFWASVCLNFQGFG
jgi:hypothetical protein